MFPKLGLLRPKKEDQPSSRNSSQSGEMTSRNRGSSSADHEEKVTPIIIDGQGDMSSVALLKNGKYIVSLGDRTKIRRWRVDDGSQVGTCLNMQRNFCSTAVSPDGRWIVGGTEKGFLEVWNLETNKKMKRWQAHDHAVHAVDVSPDGTRIASGSTDGIVVSLRTTGERHLGPLQGYLHFMDVDVVVGIKFSPDGRHIAANFGPGLRVLIFDGRDGSRLVDVQVETNAKISPSMVWTGDGKRLFVLSGGGIIRSINASTGNILAKWSIHTSLGGCIALASDGAFIATSAGSTVSFWDAPTQKQVGSILHLTHHISSMVISGDDLHLAACGEKTITLRSLRDTLQPPYTIDVALKDLKNLRAQLAESQQACQQSDNLVQTTRKQEDELNSRIVQLEDDIKDLRYESQHAADHQAETVSSLYTQKTSLTAQTQDLQNQLDMYRCERDEANLLLRKQEESSNQEIMRLEKDNQRLRDESQFTADDQASKIQDLQNKLDVCRHERDEANLLLRAQEENSNKEIGRLERTVDSLNRIIRAHEQKHQCEALFDRGCISDAASSLLEIEISLSEDRNCNEFFSGWLTEFMLKCIKTLEKNGDEASTAEKQNEAIAAYASVLSLSPLAPVTVITKWARMILTDHTASKALSAAAKFRVPRFVVYHTICNILEGDDRLTEAVECFCQMKKELPGDPTDDKQIEWERGFREHCITKSVKLGDTARDAREHEVAIRYYWDAISLEPNTLTEILLKYSNELIQLNPSSYEGYQQKHIALSSIGRYSEAFEAFQLMLAKVNQSRDPRIQELRHEYLDVTPLIKQEIQKVISPMPRLLIDAETGRLYDKTQQAALFEDLPVYHKLRSSMTTRTQLDLARIQDEVKKFYRYVMFSHRWELNGEPLLHDIQKNTVYVLEATSPNMKLQTLCKTVRALGFKWVWSDTCCIDKDNNVVLQESLVAMFSWYRGSALTLVHLRGIFSNSQQPGDLRESIWNSRVWTYQEYLAAETVQFYTEDWKPYLGLDVPNHKNSPQIIAEMEPGSGISALESTLLRPGLDRVREKLSLASTRKTTFVEDIAYSLLGIFSASIPVIYGERYGAVGRLLEHVLTGSGDVKILAWTGVAGLYNSCLPLDLIVYDKIVPPHIPQPMETNERDRVVARQRSSSRLDPALLETLYQRLCYLPTPSMTAHRLRLSGIVFQIPELMYTSDPDPETKMGTYRTTTSVLGDIEICTADDLRGMRNLCLMHPWIHPLLDQEFADGAEELDRTTQALRLLVRLGQPFGALLFRPLSHVEYRRVAADSLIMVRMGEEVSLAELVDNVRTIEVQ